MLEKLIASMAFVTCVTFLFCVYHAPPYEGPPPGFLSRFEINELFEQMEERGYVQDFHYIMQKEGYESDNNRQHIFRTSNLVDRFYAERSLDKMDHLIQVKSVIRSRYNVQHEGPLYNTIRVRIYHSVQEDGPGQQGYNVEIISGLKFRYEKDGYREQVQITKEDWGAEVKSYYMATKTGDGWTIEEVSD